MNIEVNDSHNKLVENICKEIELNPSQLMEYLMDIMQHVFSLYKRQKNTGVKIRSFKEFVTYLLLEKSKLRTPDIAEILIESTNELLGIKEYAKAGIYNIYPDFDRRSFFYTIGYEFCVDAADTYAVRGLLIEVGMNQDYIEVSHVDYLPTLKNIEITDKKVSDTNNLVQDSVRDVHREEFSPFVNIEIKLSPTWDNLLGPSSERRQIIEIKLIVKADKGTYMPSIEKLSLLIREVHALVHHELLAH